MVNKLIKQEPPYTDVKIKQAELGEQLKYMRKDASLSVVELAELTGLSTKTIWKLEKGKNVELESFLRVLESLRYEIEFLEVGLRKFDINTF